MRIIPTLEKSAKDEQKPLGNMTKKPFGVRKGSPENKADNHANTCRPERKT